MAEGVGGAIEVAKEVEKITGIESRATILGHIQRGGSPTVRDRVMAGMMGSRAVEHIKDGIGNRVVVLRDNKVVDIEINEALEVKKEIDENLIELSKILSL